jgi:hypothetical protein
MAVSARCGTPGGVAKCPRTWTPVEALAHRIGSLAGGTGLRSVRNVDTLPGAGSGGPIGRLWAGVTRAGRVASACRLGVVVLARADPPSGMFGGPCSSFDGPPGEVIEGQ